MALAATSLLLVASAWVDLHEAVTAPESSGSSGKCMMEHCGGLMMKCMMDASCRADFACSKSCVDMLPKDTSPGKIAFQNCTLQCGYEYSSAMSDQLMTCVNEHGCISLPRVNYPGDPFYNQCAPDAAISVDEVLSQADLDGTWWASAGFHPVYDCSFACQKTTLAALNQSHLVWQLGMDVPLRNGSARALRENWPLPRQSGAVFWLNHTDLGMEHVEHWFLMGRGSSWVALYYCGQTGNDAPGATPWVYSGGILFTRTLALEPGEEAAVARAYSRAGFQMSDACRMDNTPCAAAALIV